ncbi:MAG: FHA domain-containing protein [Cyanobacteria bacterium P01_F01_bin.42]
MPSILDAPKLDLDSTVQADPVLIIKDDRGQREIILSQATYSLGRDLSNTIQLHDRAASRHHLLLVRVALYDGKYVYRVVDGDANGRASLNGITINGILCSEANLTSGDVIKVGQSTTLRYACQHPVQSNDEPQAFVQEDHFRSPSDEFFDPTNTMTTILSC